MNLLLTILIYNKWEHKKDAKSNIFLKSLMLKLNTHSQDQLVFFCFLITPRFTGKDYPVSDRMYSIESRKCTILHTIIQTFSGGRPQTPSP